MARLPLPGLLDGLRRGGVVQGVSAALTAGGVTRTDAVIVDGDLGVARALAAAGWNVATVASGKAVKRAPTPIEALPTTRAVAAVVACGLGATDPGPACGAVRDGGVVVLVGRGVAATASRAALVAGLAEIEQRSVGAIRITSGLVTDWTRR